VRFETKRVREKEVLERCVGFGCREVGEKMQHGRGKKKE
jgi:hypothetical protein